MSIEPPVSPTNRFLTTLPAALFSNLIPLSDLLWRRLSDKRATIFVFKWTCLRLRPPTSHLPAPTTSVRFDEDGKSTWHANAKPLQ